MANKLLTGVNRVIGHFDLYSKWRKTGAIAHAGGKKPMPMWLQYLMLVAGISVEPLLRQYMTTGAWNINPDMLLGRAAFGIVIALG